jgi:hypothetical protein
MKIQLTLDLSTFKPNQTEALIEFVQKFTKPYCVPTPDFDDYPKIEESEQARGYSTLEEALRAANDNDPTWLRLAKKFPTSAQMDAMSAEEINACIKKINEEEERSQDHSVAK